MSIKQKGKLKKIVFTATEKSHADLKIKLHYDGLTQVTFYRMMMEGYITEDERVLEFVQDWKDTNEVQSKRQRKDIKKEYKNQKELKSKFALDDTEVESIFDLLEKEHPDL